MKRCQRCSLDFPDNRKFCESCGSKLVDAARSTGNSPVCPSCQEPVQPEWKFCKNCRAQLVPLTALASDAIGKVQNTSQTIPTAPQSSPTVSMSSAVPQPVPAQRIVIRCRSCKNLVDEDSAFCEFCGANMMEDAPPSDAQSQPESPNADDLIVESSARSFADEMSCRDLSAIAAHLPRSARHRLSVPRPNHCGYALRSHLSG